MDEKEITPEMVKAAAMLVHLNQAYIIAKVNGYHFTAILIDRLARKILGRPVGGLTK